MRGLPPRVLVSERQGGEGSLRAGEGRPRKGTAAEGRATEAVTRGILSTTFAVAVALIVTGAQVRGVAQSAGNPGTIKGRGKLSGPAPANPADPQGSRSALRQARSRVWQASDPGIRGGRCHRRRR